MTAVDHDAVIVKVMSCSVCRTDISQFRGELGEDVKGKIPGHEVRARVVAVNSNKSRLQPGGELVYFGATDFGRTPHRAASVRPACCDGQA